MELAGCSEECAPAAAPAAAGALPCQFRNNSDSPRTELTSAQRKTAHAVTMNVIAFVEEHGFDNCGFLTITFADDLTWREAQRRFNSYARRVLRPLFPDYIRALEFTKRGRPHYHLVVACHGDIRTGFNFDAYKLNVCGARKRYRRRGALNRNALLTGLHTRLNHSGNAYQIGRQELVPLRTCADAVGHYIGGYLSKGLPHRLPEHKGARFVCYSRSFQRKYKGGFSWAESGREWRLKLAIWAAKYRCDSLDELRAVFGPRWAYLYGDRIRALVLNGEPMPQAGATAPHTVSDWVALTSRLVEPSPPTAGERVILNRIAKRELDAKATSAKAGKRSAQQPRSHCEGRGGPARMFPLEERFEENRGSPLVSQSVGDSTTVETRQIKLYAWKPGLKHPSRMQRTHYQRQLRI